MTASTESTASAGAPLDERRPRGRFSDVASRSGLLGIWVLLIVLFWVLRPETFMTGSTFKAIFSSQQALVFLAAALLCTIIVGEFVDLSVPSVLSLSATILPLLAATHGWNEWVASLVAILACALVGCINGGLVVYLGVNTIVVTLGMSTFLLGIELLLSGSNYITGLSLSFQKIDVLNVLGLPISFYYGIAGMLVFAYVLGFTPLGKHLRFVGSNREVSRLAGVRVNRIRFGAFVAAAVIAGIGGVIASAGIGGWNPSVSDSYLLPMFAATFLGTATVQPGRFNPIGTLAAIYFLATGIQGLQLLGAGEWVTDVFYGGALVIAVAVSTIVHRMLSGRA
ncbi:MAG TPA: ABC transporter permease [Solirubrobacteraceae bacterium]|jgi:ribose transport system permease protein|nr:ABC transporter permease [Solirubrobacteraceae bacterium]